MLNTILFDLDGTLVPFVQDEFIHAYLSALIHRLAPMGYKGEELTRALWNGVDAMVKNDGSLTNRQVFWESLIQDMGMASLALEPLFEDFYRQDFNAVQSILRKKVDRGPLIHGLREKGYTLILATNPVFPMSAVETRMSWVGLKAEDFDLITTYENSRHSKPDPGYYQDILAAISRAPEDCLMVGNHPTEDMAALNVGLEGFLVTDYLENPDDVPIEDLRHGDFQALTAFLEALPRL